MTVDELRDLLNTMGDLRDLPVMIATSDDEGEWLNLVEVEVVHDVANGGETISSVLALHSD